MESQVLATVTGLSVCKNTIIIAFESEEKGYSYDFPQVSYGETAIFYAFLLAVNCTKQDSVFGKKLYLRFEDGRLVGFKDAGGKRK